MPSYSSDQFFQDWRYAVEKDFVTSDGRPFAYASNGKQQWGDEIKKMSFDEEPHDGCVSADGSRIAVATQNDIHVIDTQSWNTITTLKGHISRVSALAFKPGDANTLVSSEQQDYGRTDDSLGPVIIVWKIDQVEGVRALEDQSLKSISAVATSAAANKLVDMGVHLPDDGLKELEEAFAPVVARVLTKTAAEHNIRIHGRLQTSFQSELFSPSGKHMAYLPGQRPRSNDSDVWDIAICSTDRFEHLFTLKGHSDAIMWTGWSPDESRIASVAWDGTIRIWDSTTGQQTHQFETNHQNWAGAFSPNSEYLAATDGLGIVRVYSLQSSGSTYWEYSADGYRDWRRTVAWHPNSKWLAVGGESCGDLLLLDVEKKEVLQERMLSPEASQVDDSHRGALKGFCGVSEVKFVDKGHKLALWIYGDSSIEVYDITQQVKWRFARGGTEDGPEAEKWRDENGKVTTKGGNGMLVWGDSSNEQLMLVSLDFDGIRAWAIRTTDESAADD